MITITRIELPSSFVSVFEEAWSISPEVEHIIGTYLTKQTGDLTTSDYHAFIGTALSTIRSILPHVLLLQELPEGFRWPIRFGERRRTHDYTSFDYLNEAEATVATSGRGINDHGDHVGFYRDADGATRGYVCWQGSPGPEPFNVVDAVFAPNAGSINNACFGLNNLRQVVGVVTDAEGTCGFMAKGKQAAANKVFAKNSCQELECARDKFGRGRDRHVRRRR